jgi:hypothetical protein
MADWKQIIGAVAPALATTAGTPLIGSAVQFLVDNFLTDDERDSKLPDEVKLSKVMANLSPERMAQLKQLDNDYNVKMQALDIDVFKLEVQDRSNARLQNKDSKMPAILCLGLSAFVGLIIAALLFVHIPDDSKTILELLLGIIIREWAGSMHYWYGTTRENSDRNRATLTKL